MTEKSLPAYDELPPFKNYAGCAWDVWGPDDQLGTVNLLTKEVLRRTAEEEVRTGETVSLNWPLNFPEKPMFERKSPCIENISHFPTPIVRDDILHINTQSGTQWDGMKHFGVLEHLVFYQNTPADSLPLGQLSMPDPTKIDMAAIKLGIHNWAQHGINGRGVLLDLIRYHTANGTPLPYDPWSTHPITVAELEACARKQGVTFRQGDVLLIRVGFMQKFNSSDQASRDALGSKKETFAGLEQSEDTKRFLWNNHFAAVGSDQPALESWPPNQGTQYLHETLLGLWGMPIGEFFDLEQLSDVCARTGRYTFLFTSAPLNILGGCASPANASAWF